jgi:FBD
MVTIRRFKASEPVLSFVKFILVSAPLLKKLTLFGNYRDPKEGNHAMFEQKLQFRRASAKAEIIFK